MIYMGRETAIKANNIAALVRAALMGLGNIVTRPFTQFKSPVGGGGESTVTADSK